MIAANISTHHTFIMQSLMTWFKASRPHTLLLSFSVIFAGSLQVGWQQLHISVLFFALLSAAAMQLVSNFANDYGDFQKGTDANRPENYRALSAKQLTLKQVKVAIIFCSLLSIIAILLLLSCSPVSLAAKWTMFIIGVIAIIAAMAYTLGKRPYGYLAMGDAAVFIFFGLVGVVGSYFLQHAPLANLTIWALAAVFGGLSTSVLNINNIRDTESDVASGKITLANLLKQHAITYQYALFALVLIGLMIYTATTYYGWVALLVGSGLMIAIRQRLLVAKQHNDFNQCLAFTVKSTMILSLTVGLIGLLQW